MPLKTQKAGKDSIDKGGILGFLKDLRQKFSPRVDYEKPGDKTYRLIVGKSQKSVPISIWFSNGGFRANVDLPLWAKDAAPKKEEGEVSRLAIFKNKSNVSVRLNYSKIEDFKREVTNLVSGILRSSAGSSVVQAAESCLGVHLTEDVAGNITAEKFDFWGNGSGKYAYVVTSPRVVEVIGPIPAKITDVLVDESWQLLGHVKADSRKDALKKVESVLKQRVTDDNHVTEHHGSLKIISEQAETPDVKKNEKLT